MSAWVSEWESEMRNHPGQDIYIYHICIYIWREFMHSCRHRLLLKTTTTKYHHQRQPQQQHLSTSVYMYVCVCVCVCVSVRERERERSRERHHHHHRHHRHRHPPPPHHPLRVNVVRHQIYCGCTVYSGLGYLRVHTHIHSYIHTARVCGFARLLYIRYLYIIYNLC